MNKLVSKNPIQRFKQGKKIQKFAGGGKEDFIKSVQQSIYEFLWGIRHPYENAKLVTGIGTPTRKPQLKYPTSSQSNYSNSNQKNVSNLQSTIKKNEQMIDNLVRNSAKQNQPVTPRFLSKYSNMADTIGGANNIKAWQQKLKNYYAPGTYNPDSIWGANTQAAYEKYLEDQVKQNVKFNVSDMPNSTEDTAGLENAREISNQQTVPMEQNDFALQKSANYPTSYETTYSNPYVKELFDKVVLRNPVRYTPYYNSNLSYYTPSRFITFSKEGSKLVSKNPIERFKKNKFQDSGPVTTLKTGGNIPIYKKGSKAYATNSKYLKIANELGLYSKNDVKAYQRKLGVKDDGIWGYDTQKAYNNKFSSKTASPVQPQQAGIVISSNSSQTYKPWRPTEKVGVQGACGTKNCSKWANDSLKKYLDSKGRVLYREDEIGGHAWTRLSAGKNAKMVYSGYDGLDYNPNKYDYNLAHQRNWQAAQNLYDNFDSKTLDKNKTYLVNMYYNGSPETENAWRNALNGTTGTHTGNLYWNPDTNSWRVAHNIHDKLFDDDFIKIQGVRKGKYQYGVTAIAEAPRVDYERRDWNEAHPIKAAINRIYDFGMWKEGGKLKKKLISKAQHGTILPEVTVTSIDVNKHAGSPQHRKFIRALNSNRNEFMKRYRLSDQEYADLSKFALNLTGAESSNGYDRNVFKRTYIYPDWLIHLGKLWKRGKDSANSRGLTQIKYDDDIKNPDLQKYYIDLGIDGIGIKYDPKQMAKATLGRTLWIQDQLKKQYGDQPVHYADGTEMPQEIAQYLYWNRGKVTDKANGNPETGSTTGAANQIKYYNSRKNI